MAKRKDIGRRMPGKGHGPLSGQDASMSRFGDVNGGFTHDLLYQLYETIDRTRKFYDLNVNERMAVDMVRCREYEQMFHPQTQLLTTDQRARFLAFQLNAYIASEHFSDALRMFNCLQECNVLVSVTEERVVIVSGWQANFIAYLVWTSSKPLRQQLEWNSGSRRIMAETLSRILWIQTSPDTIVPAKMESLQSEIKKQADPHNPHKAKRLIDKLEKL